MRDIKFRGKTASGQWAYGYLLVLEGKTYIVCSDHLVRAEAIGQYTGLKDENGMEVYDGDILEIECRSDAPPPYYEIEDSYYGVVESGVFGAGLEIYRHNQTDIEFDSMFRYLCESCMQGSRVTTYIVRGNVYDNPELIKGVE